MALSFTQRMREAAKLRRTTIQDTRRQIARIYEKAAEDLAAKAASAGSRLTQQWADTYSREMKARVHEIWQQVGDLTRSSMRSAAENAVAAQVSFLSDAADLVGLDLRNRFASTFAHTPDEAIASVLQGSLYKGEKAGLSKRIWRNEALQSGSIENAINQAIAQGWSANDLALALRGYVRDDAIGGSNAFDIFNPDVASYNARRLATTAINHAYWSATLMTAQGNPYAEFLHWELSAVGTHCPYCIDYAAHEEGLGIGNFPLDMAPMPHPWCTCLWFIDSTKSLEQIAGELGRWERGEPNPMLDKAFGNWQAEKGIANAVNGGTIKLPDIDIKTGVGAKHITEYEILDPTSGRFTTFVPGSKVKDIEVFAGYKGYKPLSDAVMEGLSQTYGGDPLKWQHVKGFGTVFDEFLEEVTAEVHWFQHPDLPDKIKFLIKRYLEL